MYEEKIIMKLLENMQEIFKMIKHRKPVTIYCPKCGSSEVRLSSTLDFWLTPEKYICRNCGYAGSFFMELEKEKG